MKQRPEWMFAAVAMAGALLWGCVSPEAAKPEREVITEAHKALAARAEAAMNPAIEASPGREYVNRLRTDHYVTWLKKLQGSEEAEKGELAWPYRDVSNLVSLAEQGPAWPRPPAGRIPRATAPIAVDGTLDEASWQRALTYTNIYAFNRREAGGPRTTWRLLWDEQFLYVAVDCQDSDLIAPPRPRDGDVFADDCVEVYILPDFRFRTYWEIDVAPSGDLYDSIQCKRIQEWGLDADPSQSVEGLRIGRDVRGTLNQPGDVDQGYTVELAIPFRELPCYTRGGPRIGDTLFLMLLRMDRQGKVFKPYAYQPILAWGHNIWNHGKMELGE